MAAGATLVGRRAELESIERVLDAAREGRSGGLVLRGVPGVGKTALLDAAVAARRTSGSCAPRACRPRPSWRSRACTRCSAT
jgi:hypothetical protein